MKAKLYTIALACTLALSGCGIAEKVAKVTRHGTHPTAAGERLVEVNTPIVLGDNVVNVLNGEWTIIDVDGREVVPEDEDRPVTITFSLNDKGMGELYCFAGCNYVNGDVAFDPAKGTVVPRGNYMSTMMMCGDEANATEALVNKALQQMETFKIEHVDAAFYLYFMDATGKTLLKARRWDNNFLNGAWEITGIGNTNIPAEADIHIVIDIPGEKLHGNSGCNIFNGAIRLINNRVNGIEFSNIISTLKSCPDAEMAIERELLVDLENVASCEATPDGEGALLKNEQGDVIVTLHRLVLQRER